VRRRATRRTSRSSNRKLLKSVIAIIAAIISALFAYLGYIAGIRPYLLQNHGIYWVGFLDGALITITLLAVAFYVAYKLS